MPPDDSSEPRAVPPRPASNQIPHDPGALRPLRRRSSRRHDSEQRPRRTLPIAPVAPGVARGAHMSAAEIARHRQRERQTRDRRAARDRIFLAVVVALILAAFAGGFFWQRRPAPKAAAAPPPVAVAPDQQAAALEKLDAAVKAKHAELYEDAIQLAGEARRLDPGIHGADLLVAESALQLQQSYLVRQATRESLRRGDNPSDSMLLQALDKWMSRGIEARSPAEALAAATQKLDEATAAELSNGAVWFFRGDLLREGGRPREAHASLLSALYRQQPWFSSEIISAKLHLASTEARESSAGAGSAALLAPPTAAGDAAADLRRALREKTDPQAALGALVGSLTAWQSRELLHDPALTAPVLDPARAALVPALIPPFGDRPAVRADVTSDR